MLTRPDDCSFLLIKLPSARSSLILVHQDECFQDYGLDLLLHSIHLCLTLPRSDKSSHQSFTILSSLALVLIASIIRCLTNASSKSAYKAFSPFRNASYTLATFFPGKSAPSSFPLSSVSIVSTSPFSRRTFSAVPGMPSCHAKLGLVNSISPFVPVTNHRRPRPSTEVVPDRQLTEATAPDERIPWTRM